MAQFYIQTDKEKYFAGDTVNGFIFINVGTMIGGATGVSLKFTGYQCVKWLQATQLHRPRHDPNRPKHLPPPHDPIAAIPKNQLYHSNQNTFQVSQVQSQDNKDVDHRPKYIHTPQDRYFKMSYFQTRNMFTKNYSMIHRCSGFAPGQYSFPFSFKTFQGWPASFSHKQPTKKGIIIYHMTAAIQPVSPQFQLKFSRQITLCQTRIVQSQHKQNSGQITWCCCCNEGTTGINAHFEKDGYMPGQMVNMVIQIDNSKCKANIKSISVSVTNTVTMRSSGHSTNSGGTIFSKTINGVLAGQTAIGNQAILESFPLISQNNNLKPSCSGKLLSSQYSLNVMLNHDIGCDCCATRIGTGIPVIIFPFIMQYQLPNIFQQGWNPQLMPQTNMVLQNTFVNQSLNQMGGMNQYPNQGGQYNQGMNEQYPNQGYEQTIIQINR